MKHSVLASIAISACVVLAPATRTFAQDRGGAPEQALAASKSGTTIPMSAYSIVQTKVNGEKALTGTLAGGNPFSNPPTGSVINAVVVPTIFDIGGTIFDPTAPNSCDSGYTALNRFNFSPLVQPTNLTFNGVNVGNVQYTDGFMRAEFWNVTGGNPAYSNPISFSTAAPVTIAAGANGITSGSGCDLTGVVSRAFLNSQIASLLQTLANSGVISTTKVVLFLANHVVVSSASPPTPPGTPTCCYYGYHAASGSPPQIYAFIDYQLGNDVGVAAKQIAELMNDPLVNNATPAWGAVGIVPGCQGILEVGDPLVGTGIKKIITLNGFDYHLPEFAYFSWFFNSPSTPSLGAGGIFSSNGSFVGPSKTCPPGGTY